MKRDEAIGGMVLLLFGMITIILALRMPIGTFRAAGTGLFPLLLGIILMILSGFFLLNVLLRREKELVKKESPVEIAPGSFKPVILFLGIMALAALLFNSLGYPLVAFLLMVALLKVLGMKRWPVNIFLSLATAAASSFLFVQWLKIPLPKGWLGIWRIAFILSIIAIPCFLGMGVGKAISAEKTIRIGSPFNSGHILVDAAEKFKELVNQRSGGRIEVQIDAGSKAEIEINKLNSAGELEMQSNGTNFLELYAPPYYFFTGPYVMKDFDHYMRVWNGQLGQQARAEMEKNGNLKYLGTIYRGQRQTTAKKPLYTPADAYNLKLRLPSVPSWMAVWKAIGADPVAVPLPELYNSLKTGKAEASEGDLPQISSFKPDEVQTHLIMTNHLVQIGGMLINKSFLSGLSKADQDMIIQAGKEACDWANGKMKTGESAYLLDLQRKGMQVVIPDAESFRAKAKPAVEELFKKDWPVTTWAEVLAQ